MRTLNAFPCSKTYLARTPKRLCVLLLIAVFFGTGCTPKPSEDRLLPNGLRQHDVTFYSNALHRSATYQVLSRSPLNAQHLHVVYLLHGNGGGYRDWSDSAPIAQFAEKNYIFVMPEGHSSYWVNSATFARDRYEDYLTQDLIADAERTLPADRDRAIAGVSMGGFGALVVALHHPDLYVLAGALSPPVDMPERAFTLRRPGQSTSIRAIFGAYGSPQRNARNPFVLAAKADSARVPFVYLGSGNEPLADPIKRFAALLTKHHIAHDFETQPGGHAWQQWNLQLPAMFADLERVTTKNKVSR